MKKKLNPKIGKRRNKMKKDIQELEKKVQKLQDAISKLASKLEIDVNFYSDGSVFYFNKRGFATPSGNRIRFEHLEDMLGLLANELGYEFKENPSRYILRKKEK